MNNVLYFAYINFICPLICVQLMELCALTSVCTKMIWKTWPKVRHRETSKQLRIHFSFFLIVNSNVKCNLVV